MSPGRATLVVLIDRYFRGLMDQFVTLLWTPLEAWVLSGDGSRWIPSNALEVGDNAGILSKAALVVRFPEVLQRSTSSECQAVLASTRDAWRVKRRVLYQLHVRGPLPALGMLLRVDLGTLTFGSAIAPTSLVSVADPNQIPCGQLRFT